MVGPLVAGCCGSCGGVGGGEVRFLEVVMNFSLHEMSHSARINFVRRLKASNQLCN